MEKVSNDKHELTKVGIFDCQVCSSGTYDEALEWIRTASPAGTTGNWKKTDEPRYAPVACANGGGRTHYIFVA